MKYFDLYLASQRYSNQLYKGVLTNIAWESTIRDLRIFQLINLILNVIGLLKMILPLLLNRNDLGKSRREPVLLSRVSPTLAEGCMELSPASTRQVLQAFAHFMSSRMTNHSLVLLLYTSTSCLRVGVRLVYKLLVLS